MTQTGFSITLPPQSEAILKRWQELRPEMLQAMREAMDRHPALVGGQLLVASSEVFTPAGCFADGSVQVPLSRDPAFVARLLEVCRQHGIRIMIPQSDADLDRLAPHRQEFANNGATVVCPPPPLVELCRDKLKFAQFAAANGLAHPQTHVFPELNGLSFPAFYKPRCGSGSASRCPLGRSTAPWKASWSW